MGELGFCHLKDLLSTINTALVSDITTDSGIPIFLVRMVHNKIWYWFLFSSRCYLSYLDPGRIFYNVSPFLMPFVIASFSGKKWRKLAVSLLLLFPIFGITQFQLFNLGTKINLFRLFYMFLSIIGFINLVPKVIRANGFRKRRSKSSNPKTKRSGKDSPQWQPGT